MKIVELKNVLRKDIPIYYRKYYTAIAVLELMNRPMEVPLDFQIETKPTGMSETTITAMGTVDYPLVPLQRELKKFISALDSNGKLPPI